MKRFFKLLSIGLIFCFQFSFFNSAKAQDLYQIEQTFDHEFPAKGLSIGSGWDVRLIQTSKGTPTQLVLTTPYADFFAEDAEPTLLDVEKYSKKDGAYTLKSNQWMPHSTVVEIYTSQPIEEIIPQNGARLTIQHFDFDSVHLDIYVDSGAVLIIDTLSNPGSTIISMHDGTLDLRHLRGRLLYIWTYGNSNVTEGDIQTTIPRTKEQCKEYKLRRLDFNIGIGLATPLWIDNNRYGSPYNTNRTFELHMKFRSNNMSLNRYLSWNFGLDAKAAWAQLDNAVTVQGDQLVLDPSFGATPPRQYLYWWSIGLPVTLNYNFGGKNTPTFGLYATLTPTFNFKPRLLTKSLDADDHWNSATEKADILNRFNVRAAIGLYAPYMGGGRLEFFIDLLPTYRSDANAPQTRMFGLNFIF